MSTMKNPCLVTADGAPLITRYPSEMAAVAAGESWQVSHGDDLRWNVVDLELVTVIWGDTSDEPGVFHFSEVDLRDFELEDAPSAARRKYYANSATYADDLRSLDELMQLSYTLVCVLPGQISEIG